MVPWSVPRERVGAAETIGRLVARSAAVRASRTRKRGDPDGAGKSG